MKQRLFIQLCFDGTDYHGWQWQENAVSVQGTVQECLARVSGQQVELVGCGRTDTGVHATSFFAHCDMDWDARELGHLTYKLNEVLPRDIAIMDIRSAQENAHARFDAVSRSYRYRISRVKNPFLDGKAFYFQAGLDVDAMQSAAAELCQYTDFASFCKAGADSKTTLCKVTKSAWSENGHDLCFDITADRFLRNMVRAIVGTMLEIGQGKITPGEFRNIVAAGDRKLAGPSAAAHGLYLVDVVYKDGIFLERE